eukprot:6204136-Pleurochrysis_carterae.AAC.1
MGWTTRITKSTKRQLHRHLNMAYRLLRCMCLLCIPPDRCAEKRRQARPTLVLVCDQHPVVGLIVDGVVARLGDDTVGDTAIDAFEERVARHRACHRQHVERHVVRPLVPPCSRPLQVLLRCPVSCDQHGVVACERKRWQQNRTNGYHAKRLQRGVRIGWTR